MARRCFYSFQYKPDSFRAARVRNIGVIEGNRPATDNDWETVTRGGDTAIERWIKGQMQGRSCTVVLIGAATAGRKWINYEISESWNAGMGVVGIHIHGLLDHNQLLAHKGSNPFDHVTFTGSGTKLSTVAKCYDPRGNDSQQRYNWIREHLENAVEEAIRIRNNH